MIDKLHQFRKAEFERVFKNLDFRNSNVLEIGSGTGYQLQLLKSIFKSVNGIDVESSNYRKYQTNEIQLYDGMNIPFQDCFFDVIYSSNTLEHVKDIELFLLELKRVTKNNGLQIHILPTTNWRVITSIIYTLISPYVVGKQMLHRFKNKSSDKPENNLGDINPSVKKSKFEKVWEVIFLPRHGERGNRYSEYLLFRPKSWKRLFLKSGYELIESHPVGILYSGNLLFGDMISINTRKKLAKLFGSACYVYILKKRE